MITYSDSRQSKSYSSPSNFPQQGGACTVIPPTFRTCERFSTGKERLIVILRCSNGLKLMDAVPSEPTPPCVLSFSYSFVQWGQKSKRIFPNDYSSVTLFSSHRWCHGLQALFTLWTSLVTKPCQVSFKITLGLVWMRTYSSQFIFVEVD